MRLDSELSDTSRASHASRSIVSAEKIGHVTQKSEDPTFLAQCFALKCCEAEDTEKFQLVMTSNRKPLKDSTNIDAVTLLISNDSSRGLTK